MKPTLTPCKASGSAIETQIDENLRRLYRASLDDDLPEHLRDLLARLKTQGRTND